MSRRATGPTARSFMGRLGNYGYVVESRKIRPIGNSEWAAKITQLVRYTIPPEDAYGGDVMTEMWGETADEAANKVIRHTEDWIRRQSDFSS